MTTAFRALISIIMLAGFYVVALLLFVAGTALAIWVGSNTSGTGATRFGLFVFGVTVWAVGYGTWKAVRAQSGDPNGIPLSREQAPYLWATVDELAQAVGTRAPDEIFLVPEVNAAVSEKSRLMGLIGGRRTMLIGMPLLQTFTVAQLRSVLAHELGHFSGSHTRLAAVSYRGRMAMGRTIEHLGAGNLIGYVYRGYGRLFLLVDNAVSRRQELEADLSSVRVAGRAAAASALEEVRVLDAAFNFYLGRYVGPGLEAGAAPDDLFAGFRELLTARAEEIAALRAAATGIEEQQSRWDSHPPIGARVAAINAAPESPVTPDDRPAEVLIPGLGQAGLALQQHIFGGRNLTVLPWQQFIGTGANGRLQENMDGLLRALTRALNVPVTDVGGVLDQIEAGRLAAMAAVVFPSASPEEAAKRFADPLDALFSLAAVRSGVATWDHSWTGAPRLLAADGSELDLAPVALLAVDPATLGTARARLAELGIDVTAAKQVASTVPLRRASVLGGVISMKVAGARTDVVVLDTGVALVPSLGHFAMAHRKRGRIMDWVQRGDAEAVVKTPGTRYIPAEEIRTGGQVRSFPKRFEIVLRSGETVRIDWTMQAEDQNNAYDRLRDLLKAASAS
ncbi:Zn-dependent protease with chaperone function [Catenuloplanes nepalensis]|uniref:Zn-dependent protease with chaperone function n=1 Tax=Catenuloplanes nepalensis TaxID=587533 RepID=A0ABT9N578_9ACTN|nr:M48 family metalloprotease [Catenuloplanes nepalensis]MDP9798693.1 Zn-dependent protease with chaperone function [Catenuloplanes nepalensis]